MTQATAHTSILAHLQASYLLWLDILPHLPKINRYTLGQRIDQTFLDLLTQTQTAYYAPVSERPAQLARCTLTLDNLKLFLTLAWEGKLLSHHQYELIATKLAEVGKMLGGWQRSLESKKLPR
jgi:hypothetical protein